MALTSRLFLGDQRLEACLVKDEAHLTLGTKGPFVNKVQRALAIISGHMVSHIEFDAMSYGQSTADAVLAYKTARAIINPAYQSKPDNIVGKMTIKMLDQEMTRIEKSAPFRACCGDPIGGSSARVAAERKFAATRTFGIVEKRVAETRIGFQLPSVLRIGWQITEIGVKKGGRRHVDMMDAGNLLMNNLLIIPVGGDLRFVTPFDYPYPIDVRFRADTFGLLKAANKARPMARSELRVIVHPFVDSAPEFGITEGGHFDGNTYTNFVVINANKTRPDRLTLLHEMVHATGLEIHDDDSKSPGSFMDATIVFSINDTRDHVRDEHLQRLGKMPWCDVFPEF